jgi:D-glycerate 3-kinase
LEPDPGIWRRRLQGVAGLPAVHPSLLWGLVLPLLERLERSLLSGVPERPPVLALNGPVGAGKSTLASVLATLAPLAGLRLAVASIDDLYLPWRQRRERLAGNPFGVWRVPPGSHDVPLLLRCLADWRRSGQLRLPRFDKTLAAGQGGPSGWVETPADAVLIEGWLMGCRPLGSERLNGILSQPAEVGGPGPLESPFTLTEAERQWLPHWDRELAGYVPLWQACDGLWVVRPLSWNLPLRWRFQAEGRQRRRGGAWLPPEEVRRLVRASLASLPARLYQDPLVGPIMPSQQGMGARSLTPDLPLEGVVLLDGRRRCLKAEGSQLSAFSASSEIG